MPKITLTENRTWVQEDVVGVPIERSVLWNDGEGVSFSLVKMPANYNLGYHKHETWVGVMLVSGSMELTDEAGTQKIAPGDFYFVTPNDQHIETSGEPAMVLIVKAEPNIQYPIHEDGTRR